MNYKLMLRMLGRTLQVEALCLIIPMLVALYYREDSLPFLYTILPVGILGTLLARLRSNAEFFSQEGFTVVGLIWLSFCLFGALPFWFSGEFASFADCFFESASGFACPAERRIFILRCCPSALHVLAQEDRNGLGQLVLHLTAGEILLRRGKHHAAHHISLRENGSHGIQEKPSLLGA